MINGIDYSAEMSDSVYKMGMISKGTARNFGSGSVTSTVTDNGYSVNDGKKRERERTLEDGSLSR